MNTVKSSSNQRAFVTSDLFIVLALVAVGVIGAAMLARKLHFGWFASAGCIVVAVIIVVLGLSFLDTSARRRNRK